MSKLAEYIKLLPSGIKNLRKVIEGYLTDLKLENGNLSQDEAEIIVGRRLICDSCPFNSKNAKQLGLVITAREEDFCIHCGCPISTKTASLSSNCGIEEYNKDNPDNKLELKWHAIQ